MCFNDYLGATGPFSFGIIQGLNRFFELIFTCVLSENIRNTSMLQWSFLRSGTSYFALHWILYLRLLRQSSERAPNQFTFEQVENLLIQIFCPSQMTFIGKVDVKSFQYIDMQYSINVRVAWRVTGYDNAPFLSENIKFYSDLLRSICSDRRLCGIGDELMTCLREMVQQSNNNNVVLLEHHCVYWMIIMKCHCLHHLYKDLAKFRIICLLYAAHFDFSNGL